MITRDDSVKLSAVDWRDVTNVNQLWGDWCSPAPQAPAIAIVDSGIDASKVADFGGRVVARANFSSIEPNCDRRPVGPRHDGGRHRGGRLEHLPRRREERTARRRPRRVAARRGEDERHRRGGRLDDREQVAVQHPRRQLLAGGSSESSFRFDPLDKAVEKLWFSGVVVVAAVGNNGSANGPVKIAAPGNDPFIITVGALDTEGTLGRSDDTRASWSAYGPTADGFMKPDLSAPGPVHRGTGPAELVPRAREARAGSWAAATCG